MSVIAAVILNHFLKINIYDKQRSKTGSYLKGGEYNSKKGEVMTHRELIQIGSKWLNKSAPNIDLRSQYVLNELSCQGTGEIPDILGLRPYGNVLIEVKVSRADFLKDFKKSCRKDSGLGYKRFYLVPDGLIKPEEVPEGWGLMWYIDSQIAIVKMSDVFKEDDKAIRYIYHSMFRRNFKPQVFQMRK